MSFKMKSWVILLIWVPLTSIGFTNCGGSLIPLTHVETVSLVSDSDRDGAEGKISVDTLDGEPTDARQTAESMISLLKLKSGATDLSAIVTEANFRRPVLAAKNDLGLFSAATVIGITSLAGTVCRTAVEREKTGEKDLFKSFNFQAGPKETGVDVALAAASLMAERFWARPPSTEETTFLREHVNQYLAGLDEAAKDNPSETVKLAVFTCTAMLSLPESYLF